ncbi:transcription termination factor NusA [bacterium]|nr:transcription termination factor NusA [bacterium]
MNLSDVIDELVEERGLSREVLSEIICDGIMAAYQKRYPEASLKVSYEKKSDEVRVMAKKTVVSHVDDVEIEIGLRKAHTEEPKAKLGDEVWVPFDSPIGRIEILRAKQIIAGMIRAVEAEAVCNKFKDKEGSIVYGVIHKCERNGVIVKIQDALAFMPRSASSPGVNCVAGGHMRALLKEVLLEPRNDSQLILDQASPEFLKKLFELEVPEVFERLIDIKKVVRIPGYKAKMVVSSNDANIDPVGTCVGVGGARIKPILKEIGSEKIDVISEGSSREDLVRDALKPAEVNRVLIQDDGAAVVWVDKDQRSLAIGKMGQNIALASRLVGIPISLASIESVSGSGVFVGGDDADDESDNNDKDDKSDNKDKNEE